MANSPASALKLLAIVNATFFVDYGTRGLETSIPLPTGSLGRWAVVPSFLNTARFGHAMTATPNPLNPSQYFLYVLGGEDSLGNLLSSYEYVIVNITSPPTSLSSETHSLGSWNIGLQTVPAKAFFKAQVVSNFNDQTYGLSDYVVVWGTGLSSAGPDGIFGESYPNGSSGDFGKSFATATYGSSQKIQGGCTMLVNGFLYEISGNTGTFGSSSVTTSITQMALGTTPPPNESLFSSFTNSLGTMANAVAYAGCSFENANFYIAAGQGSSSLFSSIQRVAA